jgi:hypothetical protein
MGKVDQQAREEQERPQASQVHVDVIVRRTVARA